MLKIILLTIGFLALIESLIILIFPKQIRELLNSKIIKELAIFELIISFGLILIGFFLN